MSEDTDGFGHANIEDQWSQVEFGWVIGKIVGANLLGLQEHVHHQCAANAKASLGKLAAHALFRSGHQA